MASRLVIPVDDSSLSLSAIAPGCRLADRLGMQAEVVSVVETEAERPHRETVIRDLLTERDIRNATVTILVGSPTEHLLELAQRYPETLLYMATHARGAVGDHKGWTINGTSFDPDTSLADVPLGETEVWRFVTDVHHPVHVHLDAFQVLRRGGGGPGEFDRGWKDTVDLRPAEVVEVAVRFTQHRGRFVFHCHNLEHEDMAMMATIRTV